VKFFRFFLWFLGNGKKFSGTIFLRCVQKNFPHFSNSTSTTYNPALIGEPPLQKISCSDFCFTWIQQERKIVNRPQNHKLANILLFLHDAKTQKVTSLSPGRGILTNKGVPKPKHTNLRRIGQEEFGIICSAYKIKYIARKYEELCEWYKNEKTVILKIWFGWAYTSLSSCLFLIKLCCKNNITQFKVNELNISKWNSHITISVEVALVRITKHVFFWHFRVIS